MRVTENVVASSAATGSGRARVYTIRMEFWPAERYPPELGLQFSEIAAAFQEGFVERMKGALKAAARKAAAGASGQLLVASAARLAGEEGAAAAAPPPRAPAAARAEGGGGGAGAWDGEEGEEEDENREVRVLSSALS
eukprot:scaffold448.g5908.t1